MGENDKSKGKDIGIGNERQTYMHYEYCPTTITRSKITRGSIDTHVPSAVPILTA
jgi:hypothetical protein